MKNLLLTLTLLFLFLVGFNFEANGAYCNNIASTVAIAPTSTSQNTNTYTSGRRAFTFNATAGSTYTFSTCGNTSVDTYLRLYSGNGGTYSFLMMMIVVYSRLFLGHAQLQMLTPYYSQDIPVTI
jgi:hypothetical protein